jgi:hypothetical protein
LSDSTGVQVSSSSSSASWDQTASLSYSTIDCIPCVFRGVVIDGNTTWGQEGQLVIQFGRCDTQGTCCCSLCTQTRHAQVLTQVRDRCCCSAELECRVAADRHRGYDAWGTFIWCGQATSMHSQVMHVPITADLLLSCMMGIGFKLNSAAEQHSQHIIATRWYRRLSVRQHVATEQRRGLGRGCAGIR